MKKRLLLLLLAAVCGFVIVWYARREVPVTVRLQQVGRGDVELTVTNTRAGTIRACRRAALSMPGGGRVETLHVREGQEVATGQLLLELWNDDRKAMTAQAQAQLAAVTNRREQQCIEADNAEREAKRVQVLHETRHHLAQPRVARLRVAGDHGLGDGVLVVVTHGVRCCSRSGCQHGGRL